MFHGAFRADVQVSIEAVSVVVDAVLRLHQHDVADDRIRHGYTGIQQVAAAHDIAATS